MRTMERMAESPRYQARMGGVFWLLTAVTGSLALAFSGGLSTAVNLVATVCYVVASLIVYSVLKPVNKSLSLLAAVFSLIGCAIGTIRTFVPFGSPELPTVFFGLHCFFVGYLILKSTFLPRFVGVLMVLAGLGWLTRGIASVLSISLPGGLPSYLMGLGVLGELTLTAWLLVKGVNEERWRAQAGAGPQGPSPRVVPA